MGINYLLRLLFFVTFIFLIVLFWGFAIGVSRSDSSSPWGPLLDNKNAEFYFRKIGGEYIVSFKYSKNEGTILVGTSLVDLERYLNKRVRIKGHYLPSDAPAEQCILSKCHSVIKKSTDEHFAYIEAVEEVQ